MSGARLNTTCETTVSIPEDSDEHQEVIEVQILPQVLSDQSKILLNPLFHSILSILFTPSGPFHLKLELPAILLFLSSLIGCEDCEGLCFPAP